MKNLLILILCLSSLQLFAQSDSTKRDTVAIPFYQASDTIPAFYTYAGRKQAVYYENGFVILNGYKAADKSGKLSWAQEPKLVAILNHKKQPAKNVLQILSK